MSDQQQQNTEIKTPTIESLTHDYSRLATRMGDNEYRYRVAQAELYEQMKLINQEAAKLQAAAKESEPKKVEAEVVLQ